MAWIYSQELEGFNSAYLHGCPQSLIVKLTDTAKECFCREWKAGSSQELRYGMTLEPLKEGMLGEKSISFPQDFLARTSAVREMERAWMVSDPVYSSKLSDSLAVFDQDSFSWKTSQLSLFGGLTEFSWSSLRWGMTRAGQLSQPAKWAPSISENAGSSWPTPVASRCGYQSQGNGTKRYMLPELWKMGKLPTPTAREWRSTGHRSDWERNSPSVSTYWKATTGTNMPASFLEWIMGYPIGVSALGPSETAWFRKRSEKPLESLAALETAD